MPAPSMFDVILAFVILAAGIVIVSIIARILKLHPKPIVIDNPKREAARALLVFMGLFAVVVLWRFVFDPLLHFKASITSSSFNSVNVVYELVFSATLLLPVIVAIKRTRQSFVSIGISGNDLGRMLALGLLSSIIFITGSFMVTPMLGGSLKSFSPSMIYGFVIFALAGFTEETAFRGYLQTRLIAHIGTFKGLMTASFLFALIHLPIMYISFGSTLETMIGILTTLPAGLLLGYIMLRSQNIIPAAIFHFLTNWETLLWQFPS